MEGKLVTWCFAFVAFHPSIISMTHNPQWTIILQSKLSLRTQFINRVDVEFRTENFASA
jgi:hypothetical protein